MHSSSKTKMVHVQANGGNNVPLPPAMRGVQAKNSHPASNRAAVAGQPLAKNRSIVGR